MIIVDTGVWLALGSRKDQYHTQAIQTLSQIREPLVTTWPVITETCYLLLKNLGNTAQVRFIENISSQAFEVFSLEPEHSKRITELMNQYADLPMDLADASLIILAEHLGHGRILSVDQRDFSTYRWGNRNPFKNLLL